MSDSAVHMCVVTVSVYLSVCVCLLGVWDGVSVCKCVLNCAVKCYQFSTLLCRRVALYNPAELYV